jgi:putative ABC transport system permease protein
MWQDLRFAARGLARNRGFAAIAVLSLALGIMATSAMYSVIYGVVLNPFPYKDVDQLMSVKIWSAGQRGWRTGYTTDQFLEIAGRSSIFTGVIASTISDVFWTGEGEPRRLRGNHGTMNTFEVMGVPPLIGRTPGAADAAPGAAAVAVLGYKFWQRQFAGDPGVLGRKMLLNNVVRTVIGVMPPRFMWRGADVYLPVVFHRGEVTEGVRGVHLLGRLKPRVTAAQAEADLHPIIETLKQREPAQFPDQWRVGLLPFKETFPSDLRETLWILFGAVGLLLLIACANVSNLLLSRATSRQREMALRASLGARRLRLIRQLLTESLLLSVLGSALGVAMAYGALRAIIAIVPPDTIPDEAEIAINRPVLLFTLGLSFVTTLLFGLAPALHASTADLARALKESGRGMGASLRQALARNGMVVAEVALSLMLLVGASLMIRTLLAIQQVNLGIRTGHILTMRIPLSAERYPDAARRVLFFQELLRRVAPIPGVEAAGVNTFLHPLGNSYVPVEIPGAAHRDERPAVIHLVSQDYTKVFGIGLVEGRIFNQGELASATHLALVNRAFAHQYLADRDPLGRVVRVPRLRSAPVRLADDSFQIIGVVGDTVNRGLTNEISPEVYLPYTIAGLSDYLAVLARGDPAALAKPVSAQVYAVDRDQPVTEVRTLNWLLNAWEYAGPRFNLALFAVFAGLGLLLALVGVYGVISNTVAQQTHELGVRIALGASFSNVAGMVLARGMKLVGAGIVLGLIGSFFAARLLQRQLWNVSPFDPVSFALVSVFLLAAGLQACFWPARRAARVDPMMALRYE